MKIALLANLKANAPFAPEARNGDAWDDLDSRETIDHILEALRQGGHTAEFMEASIHPPHDLIARLRTYGPDICFNIAEGHHGDSRESQVPALLEMLRLPYTGSGVLTLTLALDKPMTKRILTYHDLPTPEFQVFGHADEEINDDLLDGEGLRFPLFLKPSREGTGIGISGRNIVTTVEELRALLADLLATYNQPVLCERFIRGRELTVGLVGNLKPTAARRLNDRTAPEVLPPELTFFPSMEVDTDKYEASEAGVYTNRIKVELAHDFYYTCPAKTTPELEDRLRRLTAAVFRVCGCRDVARVDFRIDETDGRPYILEINPLPGLNAEYSDLCIEAGAAGWSYEQLINAIVGAAAARYGLQTQ
jgi:D-alanine-D-alanine ligase